MDLECIWSAPIDFGGLSQADRDRIAEIGFDPWLDEVVEKQQLECIKQPPPRPPAPKRKRKTCPCGRQFLAKREDATYCSARCRQRASRNNLTVTDKPQQRLGT